MKISAARAMKVREPRISVPLPLLAIRCVLYYVHHMSNIIKGTAHH
jgi:hypothetical protein